MKNLTSKLTLTLVFMLGISYSYAQNNSNTESLYSQQEFIDLSKQKWQWMANRNVDSLSVLFHDEAVFVHMGGSMTKKQELDVIKSSGIHYKYAEIKETSVRFVGNTAIILDNICLTAVVGGNEVVNPFIVTEIFVLVGGKWKLASLSFTRLLGQ